MRDVPEGIHAIEPHRLIPSACQYAGDFVRNGKFTLSGGSKEAFVDGKLGFKRGEEKPDGCYKTIFFPCYRHSGVVYQADDNGLELAFNFRLGCARMPKDDVIGDFSSYDGEIAGSGYHNMHLLNQSQFFDNNVELTEFKIWFEDCVKSWFSDIGDLDERLIAYAQKPHPKRVERLRALRAILDSGDFFHATFNRKVTGKVKRAEVAKFLKACRLVNNLTCEGSLLAGFIADQIKQCMATVTADNWFQFIKSPNLNDLKTVFERLIDPTDQMYFPFFSDDSCVSIRCVDGVFMANVDISSCDGSHTSSVFELLRFVTKGDSRLLRFVDGAIKQCEMPLTLCAGGSSEWVKLEPSSPTLYSGSCLTTLINNFANIAIACAIKSRLYAGIRVAECEELVRSAACAAGYVVTVVCCDTYHDLQFLKHSPCRALCGTLVPVLNLGVILRSSGNCWGDLPTYKETHGKLSFKERAHLYNVSQVQCYSNSPTYPFIAALRAKYHSPTRIFRPRNASHFLLDNISSDFSGFEVSNTELALRYKVDVCDMEELCCTVADGVISDVAASRAILKLDYGL